LNGIVVGSLPEAHEADGLKDDILVFACHDGSEIRVSRGKNIVS
jgi:hypothetical protein